MTNGPAGGVVTTGAEFPGRFSKGGRGLGNGERSLESGEEERSL